MSKITSLLSLLLLFMLVQLSLCRLSVIRPPACSQCIQNSFAITPSLHNQLKEQIVSLLQRSAPAFEYSKLFDRLPFQYVRILKQTFDSLVEKDSLQIFKCQRTIEQSHQPPQSQLQIFFTQKAPIILAQYASNQVSVGTQTRKTTPKRYYYKVKKLKKDVQKKQLRPQFFPHFIHTFSTIFQGGLINRMSQCYQSYSQIFRSQISPGWYQVFFENPNTGNLVLQDTFVHTYDLLQFFEFRFSYFDAYSGYQFTRDIDSFINQPRTCNLNMGFSPQRFRPINGTYQNNRTLQSSTGTRNLQTTDYGSLSIYTTYLEDLAPGQQSAYSPNNIDFLNLEDFSGEQYPEGDNLYGLINTGTQNAQSIWAQLLADSLVPVLYCKVPGILDILNSLCPNSCIE